MEPHPDLLGAVDRGFGAEERDGLLDGIDLDPAGGTFREVGLELRAEILRSFGIEVVGKLVQDVTTLHAILDGDRGTSGEATTLGMRRPGIGSG